MNQNNPDPKNTIDPDNENLTIKGFTLTELLVAAMMTVLVLTLAGSFTINIFRQDARNQARGTRQAEIERALRYIKQDIVQAERLENSTNQLVLNFPTDTVCNATQTVTYSFADIASGTQIWLKPGVVRRTRVRNGASNTLTPDPNDCLASVTSTDTLIDGIIATNPNPLPTCTTGWTLAGAGGFRFCIAPASGTPSLQRQAEVYLYGFIGNSDPISLSTRSFTQNIASATATTTGTTGTTTATTTATTTGTTGTTTATTTATTTGTTGTTTATTTATTTGTTGTTTATTTATTTSTTGLTTTTGLTGLTTTTGLTGLTTTTGLTGLTTTTTTTGLTGLTTTTGLTGLTTTTGLTGTTGTTTSPPVALCTVPDVVGTATNTSSRRTAVINTITSAGFGSPTITNVSSGSRAVQSITPSGGSSVPCTTAISITWND
ncbi:hypothetical protein [Geminocystis sp. NIES-3709]|uniref:hypothetical protein n=1 Tax=Geminocystis sp. NIES-3709 TaxID=1617448 RepID=UPI0005FCBD7D|nr:hypothetical protein [Geminocystis sp. NIES-3709]BAQ66672.1 filamentous haemagglutinin family outer membrane protein associated with VreARI signalling system [Geminocystis sp. NIES-3709]